MRCPINGRSGAATVLLFLVVVGGLTIRTIGSADEAQNREPEARRPEAQFTPPSHAALYAKLCSQTIQLNFDQTPIDAALRTLSAALGAPIELDRTGVTEEELVRKVSQTTDQPITLKAALQATLNSASLHYVLISFDGDGVRLVKPEAVAKRFVLTSHDLRGAPEYSTLLRREFIQQVQRTITPIEWQQKDGPWIGPSVSVFTIDVYHRPDQQTAIRELWQKTHLEQQIGYWTKARTAELFGSRRGGEEQKLSPAEVEKRIAELRAKYPFESLAKRLEYEAGQAAEAPLSEFAAKQLDERDESHEQMGKARRAWYNLRGASLEQLHSAEVEKFIAREGFGRSRMPTPSPSNLPLAEPPQLVLPSAEIDPPTYTEQPVRIPVAAEPALAAAAHPAENLLAGFHASSELRFLAAERLGYAKDRDHVAGFVGHAVTGPPRVEDQLPWYAEPQDHWAVRRMELVSLLKHEEPRVYSSSTVPRMAELGKAPTRPLDGFEAAALEKLQAGENLSTRATTNRIEMLGALRASKQCLECHQVNRGQLLGAFSYTLVRDPLLKP